MKKEYELILLACAIGKSKSEMTGIDMILEKNIDWVEVAGILMNHRLGGYFYSGLSKEQKFKMPKELRRNFKMLVDGQITKQEMLNDYIIELNNVLGDTNIRYTGLKGIIYGACLYEKGTRRSNDIDLLVHEDDLAELDKAMRNIGYIQSNMPNGQLVEATKKEKLIQRMNYHDLVPYMQMSDKGLIEVDVNFLFDGKDNLIDNKVFERGTRVYRGTQYDFRGLEFDTNLAFLISHFYREAIGELWVNNKRNLVLYKIVDIVNYIRRFGQEIDINSFVELLEDLNLVEKALYTFLTIEKFYGDLKFVNVCVEVISNHYNGLYQKYVNDTVFDQYLEDSFNLGR